MAQLCQNLGADLKFIKHMHKAKPKILSIIFDVKYRARLKGGPYRNHLLAEPIGLVNKSRNKIHQTWRQSFSQALYISNSIARRTPSISAPENYVYKHVYIYFLAAGQATAVGSLESGNLVVYGPLMSSSVFLFKNVKIPFLPASAQVHMLAWSR